MCCGWRATAGLGRNLNRIPISRVLGLSEDGLNGRCPMQEVSMGLPAIIVPLNALGALKRCRVDRESGTSSWWRVRRPRTSSSSASSRTRRLISLLACATTTMASRKIGPPAVPPDTSPGTLWNTATLARTHRRLARAGVRDRTPSSLYLPARKEESEIGVYVGRKVRMVVKGELL
jgi:trans-2,3-dihydro-3-hydroxyanthranilate isomerase